MNNSNIPIPQTREEQLALLRQLVSPEMGGNLRTNDLRIMIGQIGDEARKAAEPQANPEPPDLETLRAQRRSDTKRRGIDPMTGIPTR